MSAFAVVLFGVLADACLVSAMLHINPSAYPANAVSIGQACITTCVQSFEMNMSLFGLHGPSFFNLFMRYVRNASLFVTISINTTTSHFHLIDRMY